MRNRWLLVGMLTLVSAAVSLSQDARPNRPVRPVPRWPDGRVNLNSRPAKKDFGEEGAV